MRGDEDTSRGSLRLLRTPVRRVPNDALKAMPGGMAVIEAREAADDARRRARKTLFSSAGRGAGAPRVVDAGSGKGPGVAKGRAKPATATAMATPRAAAVKRGVQTGSNPTRQAPKAPKPHVRQPPQPSTVLKANVRRQEHKARPPLERVPVEKKAKVKITDSVAGDESCSTREQYRREGGTKLTDLCDEDKSKVAHLLAQAVHSAEAKKAIDQARTIEHRSLRQVQQLRKQNEDVIGENSVLKSKLSHAFSLIKMYQRKIKNMLELNQKMQMDHNVAIVNLHRRYEDLEKKVGDRDYDAKILSASLELSRAPGAGEHDAQRGRQRDSSELEESAQDCAVGTERIATAVEAEQQLSERPPASVDAKEGGPKDASSGECTLRASAGDHVSSDVPEEARVVSDDQFSQQQEHANKSAAEREADLYEGDEEVPVVRFHPEAGPGALFQFSTSRTSARAEIDASRERATESKALAGSDASISNGDGVITENATRSVPAASKEIEYNDSLFSILESVDAQFDACAASADDDSCLEGINTTTNLDEEAAAMLREIAEQPDLSEQIFGRSGGGVRNLQRGSDDRGTATGNPEDDDHMNVGEDDLLSVLLNGQQSIRAVCQGQSDLESQLIRRLFASEKGHASESIPM